MSPSVKLQSDLSEFVGLLSSHGVEYLVVGGHAVAFHGYPRFTGDIDFFVRPTHNNAKRLMAVLLEFGFADAGLEVGTFSTPDKVVQLGRPPNRIDLMTSISGVTFDEAWDSRVPGRLADCSVFFLGKSALMKNKRASGRVKDLADLEYLQEEPEPDD